MFMEYCNEGTLWSIAQQGLTEQMIRHYTKDLLKAVFVLHDRGIVHRDIKGKRREKNEEKKERGKEEEREGGRGGGERKGLVRKSGAIALLYVLTLVHQVQTSSSHPTAPSSWETLD